jgi:hypothetical protein
VTQVQAEARLAAEFAAHQDLPLSWLKQGPGKETPTSTGWTTPVKPQVTSPHNQINVLLTEEMHGVVTALLQILVLFPEARTAVAKALVAGDPPRRKLSE